jgi:hypothetical protein
MIKGEWNMVRKMWGAEIYKKPDIQSLEEYLFETLVPVTPSTEFVGSLRERLLVEPQEIMVQKRTDSLQGILIGSAGVLSGILILALGVRAIIALLGGKGYLQQFKNQMQQKRTQALQSAP